jgi:hypothetical protein
MILSRFTYLFFVALLLFSANVCQAATHDIVFDIDQTIAYKIHEELGNAGDPLQGHGGSVVEISYSKPEIMADGSAMLNADGSRKTVEITEKYRVYDGVVELLQKLKDQPDVRVSFFSGGSTARNQALLEGIHLKDGSQARELAYRVLGEEDLTRVSHTGRYRDMFRKDLRKVNPDTANVIMVDDIAFVLDEQKRSLIILGEDFPYKERKLDIPITEELTIRESEKIKRVSTIIFDTLQRARQSGGPLSAALISSPVFCQSAFSAISQGQ